MTTQEVVLQCFREGVMAPSAIDVLLKMPSGRAHDLIVSHWAEDKERAKRRKGGESAASSAEKIS